MSQQSREQADEEVREATELLEATREHYSQVVQRYMTNPVGEAGLEEVETAWGQIKDAERNLNEICTRTDQARQ